MKWLAPALALIACAFVGACYVLEVRLDDLERIVTRLIEEEEPLTAKWKHRRPTGFIVTIEVSVPQDPGEGDDAWAERAEAKIAAMEAKFPPNVEQ